MLTDFLCFTASFQKFLGRCMTRPYKRACHQTNFILGRIRKGSPFLFYFSIFFIIFLFLFFLIFTKGQYWLYALLSLFLQGHPQADGVPPNNSGDMRWDDNYRKIVYVSVIVVVIAICMCPAITK